MATINLGRVKPVFRGAYNSSTAYVVDDIVTSSDETFICIQASTGNATSNATYWTKLAAKGTDGTDVGTTLTTQGDILYRDGSGLARLAAGTSGQVLQTGGSGANPSWGTVSSDYVKLASATVTSGSSFNVNGYFSSTYQTYKLYVTGVQAWLKCRFNFGASYTTYSSGNYVWIVDYAWRGSSSDSGGSSGSWNTDHIPLSYWSGDNNDEHHYAEVTINKPTDTSSRAKNLYVNAWNYDSTKIYVHQNAGFLDANKYDEALTGLYIFPTSGTLTDISWELYGMK